VCQHAGMARVFIDPPVLCGHRGSGPGVVDGQRENTLGSYRAAVAGGLRWVEVDARAAADGVLVAVHDPALEDRRFVSELPAEQTGLMRVADLLDDLPPGVGIDIDVKTSLEDALRPREQTTAALVAEIAARERVRRPVLVTSFDPAALLIVRERAPGVPVGLLTWTRFPLRKAIAAARHLGADVVAAHLESFLLEPAGAARCVAVAHEAGLEVIAWGATPEVVEAPIAAGVDCLVVDAGTARAVLADAGGEPPATPRGNRFDGRG
jgi:glycerophosphoryl diester phosphodiesterase